MQPTRRFIGTLILALCVAGPSLAQDRGTKEEAVAMVKAGIEHIKKVGPDQAYKDFTFDKANWTKKDLYVAVFDSKNVGLAHGANEKIVGRDMGAVKDVNGVAIVPGMNKIAATQGKGWLDYDWPHPHSKKIEHKSSYAEKLPSGEGFIVVGVYR